MIKKFFVKDSVLKIVSVLIAILVWLYVIYVEDPEIEITVDDVPVSYSAGALSDDLILISYDQKTVDVKVRGNRSDVMKVSGDDISAMIDLSSLSESGDYTGVKIDASTPKKGIDVVGISENKTDLVIDYVISKQFDVATEFEGSMPEGFVITDSPSLSVQSVRVRGAKAYVNAIKGAYVKINCDGLSENGTIECKIYLKDSRGDVIGKNHAAADYIELSDNTLSAYITVGKTTMAKIEIRDGESFEGSLLAEPSEIEIYSDSSRIDKIYTESISDKEADKDGYIKLKLDIPDGVTVIGGEDSALVKVKKD